jgi:hypothetical protein
MAFRVVVASVLCYASAAGIAAETPAVSSYSTAANEVPADAPADAVKPTFPNGLKPVSDACHRADMGFMIWFEPERVVTAGLVMQYPYLEPGFSAEKARTLVEEVKGYRKFWYADLYPLTPPSPAPDKYMAVELPRANAVARN